MSRGSASRSCLGLLAWRCGRRGTTRRARSFASPSPPPNSRLSRARASSRSAGPIPTRRHGQHAAARSHRGARVPDGGHGAGEPKPALRDRGRIAGYDRRSPPFDWPRRPPPSSRAARMSFPDRAGAHLRTSLYLRGPCRGRAGSRQSAFPAVVRCLHCPAHAPARPRRHRGRGRGPPPLAASVSPRRRQPRTGARSPTRSCVRPVRRRALEVVTAAPLVETRFTDRGLVNDQRV